MTVEQIKNIVAPTRVSFLEAISSSVMLQHLGGVRSVPGVPRTSQECLNTFQFADVASRLEQRQGVS